MRDLIAEFAAWLREVLWRNGDLIPISCVFAVMFLVLFSLKGIRLAGTLALATLALTLFGVFLASRRK